MLNRTKKLAAAVFIAGAAIGAIAPVVSAEEQRGLSRDVNRVWNRDANRIMNRDVGRVSDHATDIVVDVGEFTADTAQDAARAVRQIVNPR